MAIGRDMGPAQNPNVCSDPYTPSFWIGKPGALTQVRMPDANYARDLSDHFGLHDLLDGQAVDRSPYQCRTWTFAHEWLKPEIMTIFMEYATRQRGFGPFILIDPQMKNLLTPNQASGTDSLHTSEGFATLSASESLSSSTTWSAQGERSLNWSWTPSITGSAGVLRIPSQTGLYGFCLPVGATFAFSGQIRAGGPTDSPGASLNVIPQLVLMNGIGTVQSTVRNNVITTVTGATSTFCITGVVPAAPLGTYIEPQFAVTGSPVTGILNANPYFETNALNWTGVNGASISRDTTNSYEGVAALLIIPDGTSSVSQAQSEEVAVVAGSTYMYSAALRVSSGGSASRDVGIAWFNSSHTLISSSSQTQTPTPTIYTLYAGTAQAPVGATFARIFTNGPGVLAVANTWRVDAIMIQSTKVTSLLIDQLQFEITANGTCTVWEYGQGQPLVSVRSTNEVIPRILRTSVNYTCVEVT